MDKRDRIKEIRKHYGLSQAAFAKEIGTSRDAIANVEGKRIEEPSGLMLSAILKAFPKVNETWLLTGEGDMLAPLSREAEIAQMVADIVHCDDAFQLQLINEIKALTPEQISSIKGIILRLADVINGE